MHDESICQKISAIRNYAIIANDNNVAEADRKKAESEKAKIKKSLPGFIFQATFEESVTKSGRRGTWRKQEHAILNGLYVCDFDHISNPKSIWESFCGSFANVEDFNALGIMLVYITPSGNGLKVVAKCNPEVGNIIDNARAMAALFGLETDEACKDASRLSFACTHSDILFINDKIFDYENKEFENKYGSSYRSGNSLGNNVVKSAGNSSASAELSTLHVTGQGGETALTPLSLVDGQPSIREITGLSFDDEGHLLYGEITYDAIVQAYESLEGVPPRGSRHTWLLAMARNFRYICDFNAKVLMYVVCLSKAGQQLFSEGAISELEAICRDSIGHSELSGIPKKLAAIIKSLSPKQEVQNSDISSNIDYEYWWKRLKPFLNDKKDGYTQAVADLPDNIKLGGILTSGAMFGTYLTKAWWRHYDGNPYRLSYIVYVIGDAASGKSFLIRQDQHIMQYLRNQDAAGREWERQAKEDRLRRATSSKEAKREAMAILHPIIRYVPSTISNAKFYQRSQDAKELVDGEEMHLHLYTMESELATALRSQVGSWAGKIDLELKSFQNEYAGVDYANEQSVNGLIQVNWNQIISGTQEALQRKLKQSNITDGYVTRLALWVMPSSNFKMIGKSDKPLQSFAEELTVWGEKLQQIKGEIPVKQLVDFCYKWCEEQCQTAYIENDTVRDYFRKRVPLYMIRYTIPRLVMRQYESFMQTGKLSIKKEDLEFAKLIGDYILWMQIYYFGAELQDAQKELERKQTHKMQDSMLNFYDSLSETFTSSDYEKFNLNRNTFIWRINKLIKVGWLKKINRGMYKKTK